MHDLQQSTEIADDFLNSSNGFHLEGASSNMFASLLPNNNYDDLSLLAQSPFSSSFQNAFSPSPKSADIFLDNTLSTLFQTNALKSSDFMNTSQNNINPASVGSIDSGNYSYNNSDNLMSFADDTLTTGTMDLDDSIFKSLEEVDCVFDSTLFPNNLSTSQGQFTSMKASNSIETQPFASIPCSKNNFNNTYTTCNNNMYTTSNNNTNMYISTTNNNEITNTYSTSYSNINTPNNNNIINNNTTTLVPTTPTSNPPSTLSHTDSSPPLSSPEDHFPSPHPPKIEPINKLVDIPPPPKKPLSPYMRFSKGIWQQVKAANPGMTVCEVGTNIGRVWRELAEVDKQRFNNDFISDKVRYDSELQRYLQVTGLQASDLVKPKGRRKDCRDKVACKKSKMAVEKADNGGNVAPGGGGESGVRVVGGGLTQGLKTIQQQQQDSMTMQQQQSGGMGVANDQLPQHQWNNYNQSILNNNNNNNITQNSNTNNNNNSNITHNTNNTNITQIHNNIALTNNNTNINNNTNNNNTSNHNINNNNNTGNNNTNNNNNTGNNNSVEGKSEEVVVVASDQIVGGVDSSSAPRDAQALQNELEHSVAATTTNIDTNNNNVSNNNNNNPNLPWQQLFLSNGASEQEFLLNNLFQENNNTLNNNSLLNSNNNNLPNNNNLLQQQQMLLRRLGKGGGEVLSRGGVDPEKLLLRSALVEKSQEVLRLMRELEQAYELIHQLKQQNDFFHQQWNLMHQQQQHETSFQQQNNNDDTSLQQPHNDESFSSQNSNNDNTLINHYNNNNIVNEQSPINNSNEDDLRQQLLRNMCNIHNNQHNNEAISEDLLKQLNNNTDYNNNTLDYSNNSETKDIVLATASMNRVF